MISGITVKLYERSRTGTDDFGQPIWEEVPVDVENVLVTPTASDDLITEQDLYGKTSVYTLAIPKGDTHEWRDRKVEFFGEVFKTFDIPIRGIESLIPLDWNAKVKVERYE